MVKTSDKPIPWKMEVSTVGAANKGGTSLRMLVTNKEQEEVLASMQTSKLVNESNEVTPSEEATPKQPDITNSSQPTNKSAEVKPEPRSQESGELKMPTKYLTKHKKKPKAPGAKPLDVELEVELIGTGFDALTPEQQEFFKAILPEGTDAKTEFNNQPKAVREKDKDCL